MADGTRTPLGERKPIYWVLLGVGVLLIAVGWVGERQAWSPNLTLVLFLGGAAALATDSLFFRGERGS